ncbi:TPA: acyltransferase family protein [Pseudomonas putida]
MQTPHKKIKKNNDIEALRTLAIILVILAHVSALLSPDSAYRAMLAYVRFGYGVDIFFCISGFIITKSLIKEIPDSKNLKSILDFSIPFWIRRFWRLMPSAIFWVLMGILLSAWHGGENYIPLLKDFLWPAFAAALQFFNVIYPTCRDAGTCGTVGIYWSLSLENQFYFLLPIIAVLTGARRIAVFFGIVFLLQFFVSRQLTDPTPVLWAFRTDAIALGVILAAWQERDTYNRIKPDFLKNSGLCALLLLLFTAALAAITIPTPPIPFAMGATAVGAFIMVWAASYNEDYFTRWEPIKAFCNYVGSRSYAIYLTHFIVLFSVRHFMINPIEGGIKANYDLLSVMSYLITFLSATILLSELNYRFIETPLRIKGEKISRSFRSRSGTLSTHPQYDRADH